MVIVVDENIPLLIQKSLSAKGFEILSIREYHSGIDDIDIIHVVQQDDTKIILTEDKDFGEWVFAHHITNISVVFLRYHFLETANMIDIVTNLFVQKQNELLKKFTTVTTKKIRMRDLI